MKNSLKTQEGLMAHMVASAHQGKKPFINLSTGGPAPELPNGRDHRLFDFVSNFLPMEGHPSAHKSMLSEMVVFYLANHPSAKTGKGKMAEVFFQNMTKFLEELDEYHYDNRLMEEDRQAS